MIKKLLITLAIFALFLIPLSLVDAKGRTPISKNTMVQEALAASLNDEGEWTKITFSDGSVASTSYTTLFLVTELDEFLVDEGEIYLLSQNVPVENYADVIINYFCLVTEDYKFVQAEDGNILLTIDVGMEYQSPSEAYVSGDDPTFGTATLTGQLLLPQSSDSTNPTIAFGNGNTGFFEKSDDAIGIAISGSENWLINIDGISSTKLSGVRLRFDNPSATVPDINPVKTDENTGIGSAGLDMLSLIAGGVESMRFGTDTVYTLHDFGVGTDTPPTSGGGKVIYFGDNAGDPTMDSLNCGLYGTVTAGVNELTGIDSDGNVAPLTANIEGYPNNMYVSSDYPYIGLHKQSYVGIDTYISGHGAFELLQILLRREGLLAANKYIVRHVGFTPTKNWEDSQEASRLRREQQIKDAQNRITQLNVEIAIETKPDKLAELQERKLKIKIPSPYVKRNPGSQWLISKGVKLQ